MRVIMVYAATEKDTAIRRQQLAEVGAGSVIVQVVTDPFIRLPAARIGQNLYEGSVNFGRGR